METVHGSATAGEATVRAAGQAAEPRDAHASFGTEQEYVRGGGFSEAVLEAAESVRCFSSWTQYPMSRTQTQCSVSFSEARECGMER